MYLTLGQVSSDLNIIDLDLLFGLVYTVSSTTNVCVILGVLAAVTWQVLLISIPTIYLAMRLQVAVSSPSYIKWHLPYLFGAWTKRKHNCFTSP